MPGGARLARRSCDFSRTGHLRQGAEPPHATRRTRSCGPREDRHTLLRMGSPSVVVVWQGAHMRMTLAALVVGFGVVITIAGGAALYNYGIVADETGISGWNPMLWILMFGGVATAVVGTIQIAITAGNARAR